MIFGCIERDSEDWISKWTRSAHRSVGFIASAYSMATRHGEDPGGVDRDLSEMSMFGRDA